MRRKIVKQGTATLMVSLPSKWARKNELEKGKEVSIEEQGNTLLISPGEPGKSKKTIELNLESDTESSVRTIITTTYRLGYDKIKIDFKNKNTLKLINNIINNNLIGFEIIKKSDNFCEIENITEPSIEQFENIFSKIFLNIDELFDLTDKALSGDKVDFENTSKKIQQFDNFCRRVISKNRSFEDCTLRWHFHSNLLHAERDLHHLLVYISKNKIKTEKDILGMLNESKKIYDLLKKAYTDKNLKDIERIHDLEKEIVYKQGYLLLNKTNEPIIVHHLLNSIRNFYLASSPLTGLIIK